MVFSSNSRRSTLVESPLLQPGVRLLPQVLVDAHARRRREIRQAALAELDREVAAARDLDRVLERVRDVGEEARHLVLALEVLLGREAPRPALVAEDVAGGDADARFVRTEVAGVEELHRVRRDHRQPEPGGERHRAREQRLGVRLAGALQLDVVAAGKEPRPVLRQPLGGLAVVGEERLPDVARRRPGKRDQAFAVLQPLAGKLGPAPVLVAQPGARQQVAEAQIPGARGAQQEQAVGLLPVGLVLQPAVGADDRLHPGGARRAVELDHAEEVAGVGQRQRRHGVGPGALDRLLDAHDSVAHRVLAVQPQVNETRRSHVKKIVPERSS